MTKEEFLSYVKAKLTALGYRSRRRCYYKIFDDDYLIGFSLMGSTYCKGFSITCGIIYLPDEAKMPFRGLFDLQRDFVFPMGPDDLRDIHECIADREKIYSIKYNIFEYENFDIAQLDEFFEANYQYFIDMYMDREYGLQRFRSNWKTMNRFSAKNIVKLCKRAGLDSDEVLKFLGK